MPAKIVLTGAAGLLGQNLLKRLDVPGNEIVAIDKHVAKMKVLRRYHPGVEAICADISQPGEWEEALACADVLIIGQAQIGGLDYAEFDRNNIEATVRLIDAAKRHDIEYIVHISSSVVNSMAVDFYTETKKAQEALVAACDIPQIVLRPTLMFGWFDRKHMGWLSRFMKKSPVFPVPGDGRYLRQPLYVADFAAIIDAAIQKRMTGTYNITGQERIDYIDLMRAVKRATKARSAIVRVPYWSFWLMLKSYGLLGRNPPFTIKQLKALITPDIFEVIDWPGIFGVRATPLQQALDETFGDPTYSQVALEF
ncbi:hypothetical protein GCM10009127_27200 [Alteraurantiacibacter aestuarii]|uniref:NAD-dependent epimerase/dehydratase family protein n=1 Tax=Alteraurantiacibacter aestuarii TaxID=650004 RepID=A0A844ZK61_9SPHN|nr:NAD(P)-dependent oxidoreductase [Alteraurantiacibacter aestuarii]MXO88831.1 NAD-dependent epimerase/dehydratase family protein [Alteraurantiacibacter aestuarii]